MTNKDKKIRKAKETMEIYAPLADRMGMNRIRDELEDLSFQVLNPSARKMIKNRLDQIKENNLNNFNNISEDFINIIIDNLIHAKKVKISNFGTFFLKRKKSIGD